MNALRCGRCGGIWIEEGAENQYKRVHGRHTNGCDHKNVARGKAMFCTHAPPGQYNSEEDCKLCQEQRLTPCRQPWVIPLTFVKPL